MGQDFRRKYPFSAIVRNEHVRNALMCSLVIPDFNGVLILGPTGTGKSTLLSSILDLTGKSLVTVPLNITEDRLFGTVNMEEALTTGEVELDEGIIQGGDGNILRMDDIDLFDQNLVSAIISSVESGVLRVERDGISAVHPLDTFILATSSCSSRYLPGALVDHFDICVDVDVFDTAVRTESLPLEIAYQDYDLALLSEYYRGDDSVRINIERARILYPRVDLSRKQIAAISEICIRYGVEGVRGDIACAKVSRALAALRGSAVISMADIVEAVRLCLDHRRTILDPEEIVTEVSSKKTGLPDDLETAVCPSEATDEVMQDPGCEPEFGKVVADEEDDGKQVICLADELFQTVDLLRSRDSNGMNGSLRKKMAEADGGRMVGSRVPRERPKSICVHATMREAMMHAYERKFVPGEMLRIDFSDIREKVTMKRRKNTFMFMLDTSWSITVRNRMSKVKAAVLSMLETHYVNRDKVGFMTFNEDSIDMIMEPSRNLDNLSAMIDKIPAGNGTPLSQAFSEVHRYLTPYLRKRPTEACHVVLMTDGKATRSMNPGMRPIPEALEIAGEMHLPNTDWIIIDIGFGFTKNDIPAKLADALDGRFYLLDDLNVDSTVSRIWN